MVTHADRSGPGPRPPHGTVRDQAEHHAGRRGVVVVGLGHERDDADDEERPPPPRARARPGRGRRSTASRGVAALARLIPPSRSSTAPSERLCRQAAGGGPRRVERPDCACSSTAADERCEARDEHEPEADADIRAPPWSRGAAGGRTGRRRSRVRDEPVTR